MAKPATASSIFLRNVDGGNSGLPKNSPGTVNGAPYTASEAERAESSLGVDLRPSKTNGRWRNQSEQARRARREFFKERWNLSIIPFDCGWKLVVVDGEIPRAEHTPVHTEEVN